MSRSVRYSLPALIAGSLAVSQSPALGLHGPTGEKFTANDRTERVYFHCEGALKLHNVAQDGSIPWDTTAPTASATAGAGCGSLDNGLQGNNQVSIQDSHYQGSFAGNIRNITVLAHNIYVGPGRATTSYGVNVRLSIDGVSLLGVNGKDATVTPLRSSTGLSELVKLTITGIDLMDEPSDTKHDVLLTLSGGAVAVPNGANPLRDSQNLWVYDTTEFPSGLIFNPPTMEAVTVAASEAGTLDQSQTSYSYALATVHASSEASQTFTAGTTGYLDQVDLFVQAQGTPPGNLTVRIETVVGGAPSGVVLASATVPAESVPSSGVPGWVSVPLRPRAAISAGTQYAIVLSAPTTDCPRPDGRPGPSRCYYGWGAGDGDPYPAGQALNSRDGGASWSVQGDLDQTFRTIVK